MRAAEERDFNRTEIEYQEWRKCPQWYCVKTVFGQDGTVKKSEIVVDEKTKVPVAIQCDEKPLDGAYETVAETIYYTYHAGYEAAVRQVATVQI